MDELKRLVNSLSLAQKLTILAGVALLGAGLLWLTKWKRESDFRPLYSGLAAEDAGALVTKLKEKGVDYRLSENGASVLVPSARTAELRLEMAAAGLPKTGRIGFELFDKATIGATEFVEHVNYRRALEGELERSVMSLAEVEQARVHISFPKESVFLDSREPAKASVLVKLRAGQRLSPQNVAAISNLVGSAVEGLAATAVSVLDMQGNLLARPRKTDPLQNSEASDEMLEMRQKLERDLLAKINSTLEPLLGADRFRAGASVECETTSGEQTEETFDPSKSVMLTSQSSEEGSSPQAAEAAAGGVPGTAANLPRPTGRAATPRAGVTRRTENITYQASRLVRQTRMPQGAVKRMSVSILLDQRVNWEGSGAKRKRVLVAQSPEVIKAIREVVTGATGLNTARGDQLIVESLPFESTLTEEPPLQAAPVATAKPLRRTQLEELIQNRVLVISIAAASLLLVIVRVVLVLIGRRKNRAASLSRVPALDMPVAEAGMQGVATALPAPYAEAASLAAQPELPPVEEPRPPRSEQLVQQIRELVGQNSRVPAAVLRTWVRESRT
jgi:flagellar M-ring protein FliF